MINVVRDERLSDGLRTNLPQTGKHGRLTEKTYKEIVKLFENPSNIKLAEEQIAKVLLMEKQNEKKQISKNFSEGFSKPIQMPRTSKVHKRKTA